jgi:hypothetical protein
MDLTLRQMRKVRKVRGLGGLTVILKLQDVF